MIFKRVRGSLVVTSSSSNFKSSLRRSVPLFVFNGTSPQDDMLDPRV